MPKARDWTAYEDCLRCGATKGFPCRNSRYVKANKNQPCDGRLSTYDLDHTRVCLDKHRIKGIVKFCIKHLRHKGLHTARDGTVWYETNYEDRSPQQPGHDFHRDPISA